MSYTPAYASSTNQANNGGYSGQNNYSQANYNQQNSQPMSSQANYNQSNTSHQPLMPSSSNIYQSNSGPVNSYQSNTGGYQSTQHQPLYPSNQNGNGPSYAQQSHSDIYSSSSYNTNQQYSTNPSQMGNPQTNYNQQGHATVPGPYSNQPSGMYNQQSMQPQNSSVYSPHASYQSDSDWFDQYYKALDGPQLEVLKAWFVSVDTDKSGAIDERELANMKMPGAGPFQGSVLGIEAASQLIRLFDKNGTGVMEFKEYAALHCFMDKMNTSFFHADTHKNGSLNRMEIAAAMQQAGFTVSAPVVDKYFHKYNTGKGLDFVKFMRMASDIALVKSKFHWIDADNDGKLSLDEVLTLTAELNPKPVQIVHAAPSTPVSQTKTEACTIS